MPLMVDDQNMMDNIDDLFGDGDNDGLNAALAATLDSDKLRQRIEESHRVGCCQKLAWSRTGSVAHISPDGRKITVRALVRDKMTGKSSLSDEGYKPIIAQGDARFVHIEWSTGGSELVTTDQFGRLSIHALAFALNRLLPHKINYAIPQDDLSAVVGLHWLAIAMGPQRVPYLSPSVKEGDRWQTTMQAYQYQNITHPLDGRSALLCVTRSNQLKLIYQQPAQPWCEAILELGELTSSSDIVTHAAFGDAQGQIILVTYDTVKCLRLYRVHILWNPVQGDHHHSQPPSVNPVLRVTHVQLLDHVLPQMQQDAELSQILIQPPMVAAPDKGHVQITALFTCLPDDQHQAGGRGSVVARWELKQSTVALHDVFKTLKSGTEKPIVGKARDTLHRLHDISSPKVYLNINENLYHNIIAFTSSDGTVDFRHRDTMDVITADGDSNKVSSLAQAGFAFMPSECTDMTLSPCGCVAAIAKQDGTVYLHIAEYVHGWTDAKPDHYLPQAAIVAVAREVGILFCHSLNSDDILALLPTDLDRGLRRRFLAEVLRTLSKNTDYSSEEASKDKAKVMKDNLLFKTLSLQLVLGYGASPAEREVPSGLAWAMLNLRSLGSNIMSSITMNVGHQLPDVMLSLRGLAKWHLDFMHMISHDLLAIHRASKSTAAKITKTFIAEQIAANKNTPSIHILLHSASRNLLKFLADIIKLYFQRAIAAKSLARDLAQRAAFAELEGWVTQYLAFKLPVFEQLLQEIDTSVRKAYTDASVDARSRSGIEQTVLVDGELPDVLVPVLEQLFEKQIPRFMDRVDGVKVFLAETEWLGFGDAHDNHVGGAGVTTRPTSGTVVDIIRKIKVPSSSTHGFRTCRRCASLVEDLWEDKSLMPWVMGSQRACVCLSLWVV